MDKAGNNGRTSIRYSKNGKDRKDRKDREDVPYHSVRMLIWMIARQVMTSIGETEPSVADIKYQSIFSDRSLERSSVGRLDVGVRTCHRQRLSNSKKT